MNATLQTSVCSDCGSNIELVDEAQTADGQTWTREWFDQIGRGCPARGIDGEVVAHRPRFVTNEAGTQRYYFERGQ